MSDAPLEPAEAVRELWEESTALTRAARRLSDLAERLEQAATAFARAYAAGEADPAPLLLAVGAARTALDEVTDAWASVEAARGALPVVVREEAAGPLQARARADLQRRFSRSGAAPQPNG